MTESTGERSPRSAAAVEDLVHGQGLLSAGRPVVVLVSGGADSTCLLHLAVAIAGPRAVRVLHVNYGLRPEAAADEALCRELCGRLGGIALTVHRPDPPTGGNLQAWARATRYAAARWLAADSAATITARQDTGLAPGQGALPAGPSSADIAAGHTASDQAETVLYRLASAPGRRALLGMSPRDGDLVRPLLGVRRAETEAYCRERDLPFAVDASNADPRYARNRVRQELLGALRRVHPAAEDNVIRTLATLRDEAAVLDDVVTATLRDLGRPIRVERLAALAPALRRLILQRIADDAAPPGELGPPVGAHADAILGLARRGGTGTLDVGGGLRARVSYGEVGFSRAASPTASGAPPKPVRLAVPGQVSFAGGELSCQVADGAAIADGTLDAAALGTELEIRVWRSGDRMRPLGSSGSKSLQDLLTDRKIPREARRCLPVVVSDGEIAWIPGVATGHAFRVRPDSRARVRLTWRPSQYDAAHGQP